MLRTAEGFNPFQVARESGMREGKRILQPLSPTLPRIKIELYYVGGDQENFFGVSEDREGSSQRLIDAHFSTDRSGILDRFLTDDRHGPNGPAMTVFARGQDLTLPSPYYAVFYRGENPARAGIISVSLMGCREYGAPRGSATERIAQFGPEKGDRELYAAFLKDTGLPEVADLPATMRMYLEGRFMEGGQIVPLTVEALARRIIMASG